MVSVTQPPDDRDPEFVVGNRRRSGPTTTVCYRVAGHVGSVEAGPDLLAAGTNGALANSPTVAAGKFGWAGLEPMWPSSSSVAQPARQAFTRQRMSD